MNRKNFFIENLGCAKNQVDAEIIINTLTANGWQWEASPDDAEVIIINTCGFIKAAKEESIEVSLDYKTRYPGKKIIMAGCLTERYKAELETQLYEVDGFYGNKDPADILTLLEPGDHPQQQLFRKQLLSLPGSAYLKIAEGCNNCCTYCSIPLIRGALRSRESAEIVKEIAELQAQGIVEFNLVAQDLGSYGMDSAGGESITTLFSAISCLDLDFWIRPLYIHPDHFPFTILELMQKDKRFLPYFDLPFQHASGRILKKMGRAGSAEKYLELIRHIRSSLPDAVIRSTFLTGFPGETEEDFQQLCLFQEEAELDWLGVFVYSREENTPAYSCPQKVSRKIARYRKKLIEDRQLSITEGRLDRFPGRELDILVEEPVKNEKLYLGRGYLQAPEVDGLVVIHGENLSPGRRIRCLIIKRNGIDLEAVIPD